MAKPTFAQPRQIQTATAAVKKGPSWSKKLHQVLNCVDCGKLVVVDFTASWCGPCRAAAPVFENMARQFPDVVFIKIVEDNSRDLIHSEGIQAFPTFRIYLNNQLLEEFKGANMQALEAAIVRHRASVRPTFSGSGFSLGAGAPNTPSMAGEDPRAARLRRLGLPVDSQSGSAPPQSEPQAALAPTPAPPQAPASEDFNNGIERTKADLDKEDAEDEALLAEAMGSMINKAKTTGAEKDTASGDSALQMIEPPVDEDTLKQLLEFGFQELHAKKAILAVGGSVEACVDWISTHQEAPDINEPIPLVPQLDLSALPGAGPPKKKLTVEELKARIAARRAERAEMEKVSDVEREKARRESGKNIGKTNEELQRVQRQRDALAQKKEKEDAKAERQRLLAELAKDKAERKARGGYLPGKLDAEGYNPAGLQGAYGTAGVADEDAGTKPATEPPPEVSALEQAEKAIGLIRRQRIGDEGLVALKTLLAYVSNIAAHPNEEKYRAINLDNKAYKARIAKVVGGTQLLKAIGFVKNDAAMKWELSEDKVDRELLSNVDGKLKGAIQAYGTGII